ncbi:uncharacterized protein AKAME5_000364200 [Lates japonicus]|uniref:Uncharacterized protein n=1 Tax=Lates japonicus TaxID=270547 RepID=A0AAD3QZE9_LATJO|nr:uncharacterized protein AKAME5_000364200 [Lates japonicus]
MAVSMWRMNGLWRRMAGVLVLCTLLLSNEVICQDDATGTTVVDAGGDSSAVTDVPTPAASSSLAVDSGAGGGEDSAASADPEVSATIVTFDIGAVNPDLDLSGALGTIASTLAKGIEGPAVNENSDVSNVVKVVPTVRCVGENDIPESNAVKAMVATADCEATKNLIEDNPTYWCREEGTCNLEISQNGNELRLATKIGREAYPEIQENQGNTLVSVAPSSLTPETQEKPK